MTVLSRPRAAEEAPHTVAPRLAPTTERISSIDVLRGVALLGILLTNVTGIALPEAFEDPSNYGGAAGLDLAAWVITELFFEGAMRGIFSMLFGASALLFTDRLLARGAGVEVADLYYRRTLWLLVFGVLHAYVLLNPGDILYVYGLAGLFLFPLRNLSPRTLIASGALMLAVAIPYGLVEIDRLEEIRAEAVEAQAALKAGEDLSEDRQWALEAWDEEVEWLKPSAETLESKIEAMRGGYLSILSETAPLAFYLQSEVTYRWAFWDALGTMLIGMAVFRLGVLSAARPRGFYVRMALAAYAVGLSVNAFETWRCNASGFDIIQLYRSGLTYDVGRMGMALGHIALVMCFCQTRALPRLASALAAIGRTAFSNYILQTLLCVIVFYGIGFGLYGQLARHELYGVVLGSWLVSLVVSPWWLTRYRYGPLEWAWRSLTYRQRQPLRRVHLRPVSDSGG